MPVTSIHLTTRRFIAIGLIALVLVPSTAQAASNPLYTLGVDRSWGETSEDDQAVAYAPGTFLHGLVNRVAPAGRTPGDGSRLLDARVAQGTGLANVFVAHMAADLTQRPDLLLPGPVFGAAWYGEWHDLNTNGVIDDVHDTLADAMDEFTWRGRSSGADVAMPVFTYPIPKSYPTNAFRLHGMSDGGFRKDAFVDMTDSAEQEWASDPARTWAVTPGMYDASVLMRYTMVTAADAIQVKGIPGGFDLSDPAALVDVDVYGALNPDVETLYLSASTTLKPTVDGALKPDVSEIEDMLPPFDSPSITIIAGQANSRIQPEFPREPNHILDDYGGHATFGGVGDVLGSHNTYEGYQSAPHYFVDAQGQINWLPTVDADTGTGVHVNVQRGSVDVGLANYVPHMDDYPHGRKMTPVFGVGAIFVAWFDANGDGFRGKVCDTNDPEAWDAERNTCRAPESTNGQFKSTGSDPGGASLCNESAKSTVSVAPIGGDWPGVILVRDQEHYSSVVWNRDWEVLTDDRVIELEWRACVTDGSARTRDVLIFPAGSPTIAFMTTLTSTSGEWIDAHGVRQASETVTDVDIYYPTL